MTGIYPDGTKFALCLEGRRLYDEWAQLEEAKAPIRERTAARKAYIAHRFSCSDGCTKPRIVVRYED